jgi:gluconate 2-dehydrogenase subunit 3-like protein
MDFGRRRALELLAGAPLAGFGLTSAAAQTAHDHAARAVKAAVKGQAYKPKFFKPHEWETVRLLVDLIIPRDERSGSATDAGVPEFMDFIMTDPMDDDRSREQRQTAMRGGLAWIDAESIRRFDHAFVEASDAERRSLLDDIAFLDEEEDEGDRASDVRDLRVKLAHGPAFFRSFRDLTAAGFWSSRIGVEDLAYQGNTVVAEWTGCPPEALQKLGLDAPKDPGGDR